MSFSGASVQSAIRLTLFSAFSNASSFHMRDTLGWLSSISPCTWIICTLSQIHTHAAHSMDRQGYFKSPVSKADVPDYYDIIKHPMCWDMIDQKLDRHEYLDLAEFKVCKQVISSLTRSHCYISQRDINLVLSNAMTYNQANTPFYKTASRIQDAARTELAKLDQYVRQTPIPQPHPLPLADAEAVEEKPQMDTDRLEPESDDVPLPPIGDLEPPLDMLDLLVSEERIRPDTDIILTSAPINSLLNFELPLIRPPAPPPPPLPPPRQKFQKAQKRKPKYDRKAALERKKQERKMALDASPGFRAPRTRSALAAAAAFEAEATGSGTGTSQTPEVEVEQPVAGPSTASATPEKPRRSRKSTAGLARDIPLTVEDVDSKQSFRMFEKGWILPAEHRRGGRIAIERLPLPPKKRRKTCEWCGWYGL